MNELLASKPESLREKLDNLPTQTGVYKHVDGSGTVLYVGKAKNLRSRVRSYYQNSRNHSRRIDVMVRKAVDVEVIVTDTEVEALILENNLIKEHQPRYNVNLRDDKTYPYICIKNERFPRVFKTRKRKQDGSKYFGPYTDVGQMNKMMDAIRSVFQLRTCSLKLDPEPIEAGKYDVCLQYHIDNCKGPCVGEQSHEDYMQTIDQVEKLLNGHTQELIDLLDDEMEKQSSKLNFEEAARLRDQISALEKYSQRQKIVSQDNADRDVFALHVDREEGVGCAVKFTVREGKMIGRRHTYVRRIEGRSEEEILLSFVEKYYTEANFFPDEVLLSVDPNDHPAQDTHALEQLLQREKGKQVVVKVPQRGDKASLIRMAKSNAKLLVGEWKTQQMKRERDRIPEAVKSLKKNLQMEALPRRIDGIDISHLGGTETVASCVVFTDGTPRKSEYRTYKIRTTEEGRPDDFKAMREVIQRRYSKIVEENGPWPDLLVVDGGKGQLSSAVQVLKEVEAYGKFQVIGIAKRLEEVFMPEDTDPVLIAKDDVALQLLQKVRNEAHRFAVTYQRKRRKKKTLHSELLDIHGIGPKTARDLLSRFGSVAKVKDAPEEEIAEVVGPAKAETVRSYFDKEAAEST
ncbi:excinuclease ABC subunit C [Longibacter salinarum]|uniref:UvrABC system protein C n=1 Tax=Longibacter salinarum TaxID=1850348 RepID=A0A2A8D1I6_9BACT|nr:excinuclease ABC subunit UvrC [Longibacter salinarum]PEN14754.1 excinuclease ABC subunit C [Longibacter salinarum]